MEKLMEFTSEEAVDIVEWYKKFMVTCAVGDVIKVYAKASGSSWNSLSALIYGLVACINWDNGM